MPDLVPVIGFPDTMDVLAPAAHVQAPSPMTAEELEEIARMQREPITICGYSFNRCGVFPVFRLPDGTWRRRYARGWTKHGAPLDPIRVFPTSAAAVEAFRAEREAQSHD